MLRHVLGSQILFCPVRAPGFKEQTRSVFLPDAVKLRRLSASAELLVLSVSIVLLTKATFCIVLFVFCLLVVARLCQHQCK